MIFEIATYLAVFIFSMAIWLPLYKYVVATWVQQATISRIESGDIDLNYLLDEGGVFDSLAERTVTLFKHHMLAEMGQLSRAGGTIDPNNADPMTMGIDSAGELLKMVGMRKPPAMLQIKMARALGRMAEDAGGHTASNTFDPASDFYKQ